MLKDLNEIVMYGEYVLLIGNGINRKYNGGNWNNLLIKVIREHLGEKSYLENAVGQDGITNTEIQNIIPLEYNRKKGQRIQEKELLTSVIANIEKIKYDQVLMLDRCINDKCQILTTNYDLNIENYLWPEQNHEMQRSQNSQYITSNYYPWDKSFGSHNDSSHNDGTRVWHIHGNINNWQSIILSLTRYIGAIHKANILLRNSSPYDDNWIGATTWLNYFFTKPLIIAGLALDPQELFLRWLLLRRASINQSQSHPKSAFYLARNEHDISTGKENFLKFVGVNICKIDDVYNDSVWEC
ncbi:MAG: SIR2 family protein [Victivallales bacterium]|nr:SIR2 family protein [Victivallales bacterium]